MARNPKQDANLRPLQKGELSSEEAKIRGKAGGIRSGEVRRAKRDARSAVRYLLNLAPAESLKFNLEQMGLPENEQTNMAALQARLFTKAMSGDLDAYITLMKVAGYDPEENRRERESVASDRRRDLELEAKAAALAQNIDGAQVAVQMTDEDDNNDVVIYIPQMLSEEECEYKEEANPPNEDFQEVQGAEG